MHSQMCSCFWVREGNHLGKLLGDWGSVVTAGRIPVCRALSTPVGHCAVLTSDCCHCSIFFRRVAVCSELPL